jgi:HTH-type transcriptional regulator / antitoxin HigA
MEGLIMPTLTHPNASSFPGRYADLVRLLPPQAIQDDLQYEHSIEIIDHLMTFKRLTQGQSLYLETLVQLVQAYEAAHHGIDTSKISGLDSLRHLLEENGMNASDLARLLGVHASLGSKILRGQRSLTLDHLRKLCTHFKVNPQLFMD